MHQQVRPGDTLTVSTPNNLFAIDPQARKHLLIAGDIGITPFLSSIPQLELHQADWQLHYCFHDADSNAFVDEISSSPWRERVTIHVSALGSCTTVSTMPTATLLSTRSAPPRGVSGSLFTYLPSAAASTSRVCSPTSPLTLTFIPAARLR
ncbi:hypothetical protein CFJ40_26110 [Salmonella enterica]|nr:hypothetical protein [Salmonella enterica]